MRKKKGNLIDRLARRKSVNNFLKSISLLKDNNLKLALAFDKMQAPLKQIWELKTMLK